MHNCCFIYPMPESPWIGMPLVFYRKFCKLGIKCRNQVIVFLLRILQEIWDHIKQKKGSRYSVITWFFGVKLEFWSTSLKRDLFRRLNNCRHRPFTMVYSPISAITMDLIALQFRPFFGRCFHDHPPCSINSILASIAFVGLPVRGRFVCIRNLTRSSPNPAERTSLINLGNRWNPFSSLASPK